MNICKIDGKSYDVLVTALQETATINEGANSGVAIENDREIRDITGIKIGHSITFDCDKYPEEFDSLYSYLFDNIRPSVVIEVLHNQTTISYEAAYTTGSRSVSHIDNENDIAYWSELTVDFRPIENQITE